MPSTAWMASAWRLLGTSAPTQAMRGGPSRRALPGGGVVALIRPEGEAEDERVERLRSYGVLAFSSMLYPHKPDMGAWLNSWSAEFAERQDGDAC